MKGNIILKKGKDVVAREIGEQIILVPLSKSAGSTSCIYTLTKTAVAVWELIDGKRTLNQLKNVLMDKYNISESRLEKELDGLYKDLKSIKAIEVRRG